MESTSTILDAILAVFISIGEWISEAVTAMVPMFWAEGSLTFLGTLAVAGLAFSVAFLLKNPIGKAESNLCYNSPGDMLGTP